MVQGLAKPRTTYKVRVAKQLTDAFVKANDKAKPLLFCHVPIAKGKLSLE